MPNRNRVLHPTTAAFVSLLLLSGCAALSPDGGFSGMRDITKERIAQSPRWVRSDSEAQEASAVVKRLLQAPISADTAVEIALVKNPGLQATYADIGIAQTDVVQAGRLRNPGFSFSRLRRADEIEIERTFLIDVLGLITMPLRTDLERRRFELTRTRVAAAVLRVAADTRRAYYRAVSARESASYAQQVQETAEASAELARRMAAAGNFSRLDQAREQVFYAESTAQLARTRQAALSDRERLTQLMGLTGDEIGYELPTRLPDLPKSVRDTSELQKSALTQRLDVQGAMAEAQSIASSLGLTRVTGFVSVLEVGYQRNSETGQPRQTGYEIELRLPLFDWGGARVARAEYLYMQAVSRATETAIRAQSEVREAYGAYRTAYDLARHYRDEIVPLRKRISEENVLRYNGMLISVFELLADARQQIASVNNYIQALSEFWIGDSNLTLAITGTSPGAMGSTGMKAASAVAGDGAGH